MLPGQALWILWTSFAEETNLPSAIAGQDESGWRHVPGSMLQWPLWAFKKVKASPRYPIFIAVGGHVLRGSRPPPCFDPPPPQAARPGCSLLPCRVANFMFHGSHPPQTWPDGSLGNTPPPTPSEETNAADNCLMLDRSLPCAWLGRRRTARTYSHVGTNCDFSSRWMRSDSGTEHRIGFVVVNGGERSEMCICG